MELKSLDTTKPHYSEHILSGPWPLVISKFLCIAAESDALKWGGGMH